MVLVHCGAICRICSCYYIFYILIFIYQYFMLSVFSFSIQPRVTSCLFGSMRTSLLIPQFGRSHRQRIRGLYETARKSHKCMHPLARSAPKFEGLTTAHIYRSNNWRRTALFCHCQWLGSCTGRNKLTIGRTKLELFYVIN